MKNITLFFSIFIAIPTMNAQNAENSDQLPYYEIPEYTQEYTSGAIIARMIDGLGFRYRWATENLRTEDLDFRPNDEANSTRETINHILSLSRIIVNVAQKIPTDFTIKIPELDYEQKRKETLENFKKASSLFMTVTNLESFSIEFISTKGTREYPFWNTISGPIEDAVWHSGQIASFRRTSGNPISSKVKFLEGKIKE